MIKAAQKKQPETNLTSTMEDYLETIFTLDRDKKAIRVRDIAGKLNVKMPTVTSMLKILGERGYVNHEKYEYVELTDKGIEVGQEIKRRHKLFFKFLTEILNIDLKTANEEACKLEHTLSSETMQSLADFIEFIEVCPRAGESWLESFKEYRKHGKKPESCINRLKDFSDELGRYSNAK